MRLETTKDVCTILEINGVAVDFKGTAEDIMTMRGLETIASCLGSPDDAKFASMSWMSWIALGQGDKSPSTEDKYLENELYRRVATVTYIENVYVAQTVFPNFAAAFILREVGILDKSTGGNLGARWSLASDLDVAAVDSVDVTCRIYIT